MKQFAKIIFGSFIGVFLAFTMITVVSFGIIAGVVAAASSAVEEASEEVKDLQKENTVLVLTVSNLPERSPKGFFDFSNFDLFGEKSVGLNDLLEHIKTAKEDSKVKGIYINLNKVYTSWANLEELREAVIDFKSSGKFVYAFGDVVSKRAYYLGAVADEIYVSPTGLIEFNGLSTTRTYFKGALDKLGVKMQIFKYGKYKSAVEPFIRKNMSEASREQTSAFLHSIYEHFLRGIGEGRKIIPSDLDRIAEELMIQDPKDAVDYNLIDGVKYKDQALADLAAKVGVEDEDKIHFVSMSKYAIHKETVKSLEQLENKKKDKIAVVYAEGEIGMGLARGGKGISGAKHSRAIREARKDTTVKAIVLRINSPGGSALASDLIWREVILAKEKKPVIVSMGAMAASGGYYIACPADKIVAQPNTITGSIGVFGMLPYTGGFMEEKLGVTFDVVKTNQYADLGNVAREVTADESLIIQHGVDKIYKDFVNKVAEGRGMTFDQVHEIAQGRIWSGKQALDNGLVDTIGGIQTAINVAKDLAHLEDVAIAEYPKRKMKPWEVFMGQLGGVKSQILAWQFGEEYQLYQDIKSLVDKDQYQALVPYRISID